MTVAYQKNYKGYKGAMPRLQPLKDMLIRTLHQRLYCNKIGNGQHLLGAKYQYQIDAFKRRLEDFLAKYPNEPMCLRFIKENAVGLAHFKTGNYQKNLSKINQIIADYES